MNRYHLKEADWDVVFKVSKTNGLYFAEFIKVDQRKIYYRLWDGHGAQYEANYDLPYQNSFTFHQQALLKKVKYIIVTNKNYNGVKEMPLFSYVHKSPTSGNIGVFDYNEENARFQVIDSLIDRAVK